MKRADAWINFIHRFRLAINISAFCETRKLEAASASQLQKGMNESRLVNTSFKKAAKEETFVPDCAQYSLILDPL